LIGDGSEGASVILVADPEGSGIFYYLSAVIFENGNPQLIDSPLIGDRVIIKSVEVESDQIIVNIFFPFPR
jgi:hypothetical protein